MADQDDVESLYAVPSHLKASGSIGWIPDRTFYVGLGALTLAALPSYLGYQRWGPVGILLGLVPLALAVPFAAAWLDPPAEHGLVHWCAFRFSRKVRLPQHLASLRQVRIEGNVIHVADGCRAILAMPTVNLELASVTARRRHRRQLGALLDGIASHDVQFVVRAETLPSAAALERMRLHRNPFSRRLADWLAEHHQQKQAIDRRRYLVVPAPDVETLEERVATISRSFSQIGLELARLDDEADLREVCNRWWTWRPHPERLGPERVDIGARQLQSDGTLVRVFALGKLPSTITTNWWARLLDGDLACDMSMHLEQQDLALAKWRLDLRYNGLASSNPSPSRHIALDQIRALRLAFEGRIRPWNMQVLLTVRGADDKSLERGTARLRQQLRDLGAELRLLTYEQYDGMVSAQPLCGRPLPNRPLYVESGTLARTTPLAASTLQMLDGVPWGLAGSTPILLTTTGARTGRHFGWFGFTGSGKGFGVRCYLARRHFADRLRIFMWDADEVAHEYAGRFCEFLQGIRLEVSSLADMAAIQLDPRWQVVALDCSGMPAEQQPAAFAHWKRLVEEHVLEFPGESAFVVDEATTLAEASDQSGALALGNAIQTWRKRGLECHVITQRVSDWFGTAIGRKIQGNLAVKWYGAQEDSELFEVARRVNLSDEERDRIGGAGIGQGLLVAFGRRVWADLYDHAAPFEYDAYATDPPDRIEILPTRSLVSRELAAALPMGNGREH